MSKPCPNITSGVCREPCGPDYCADQFAPRSPLVAVGEIIGTDPCQWCGRAIKVHNGLQFRDCVAWYMHRRFPDEIDAPEGELMTDADTTECDHPLDTIMWNEWNKVTQCHRCGHVMDKADRQAAMRRAREAGEKVTE